MTVTLLDQRREKRERDQSLESRVSALENYIAMLIGTGEIDPNIALPGTVTIGGRLCSTVASAINAVGELTASNFNTSTKTILGDFTFGASGAIKMITDSNNGLWLSPTGILGKKAGTTTFAIDILGNATFGGSLVGASGTFGTITAGSLTGLTVTAGLFRTASSGQRVILNSSDNTLRFYDATAEALNIGTSGGQAIKIIGNATTSRGVFMTSTVSGIGFYYKNESSVQNVGLDLLMGEGSGLTNSLPAIRIKMGGTGEILWGDISSTGKGIHITRSVGGGTANLLKLSSTNSAAGTMADITRSGLGIITALNIDHSTSSSSVNTGIIMSLSSGNASLCSAFRFNGSEVVSAAVGGTQNKKIRINIGGTTYYIPCHTA